MVREVQMSWDRDEPMPEELRSRNWDWDDREVDDVPENSRSRRRTSQITKSKRNPCRPSEKP